MMVITIKYEFSDRSCHICHDRSNSPHYLLSSYKILQLQAKEDTIRTNSQCFHHERYL